MARSLTVEEVSGPYAHVMLNPAPRGPTVCRVCWTFIDAGWRTCYRCGHQPENTAVVVPITYSIGGGQMHVALREYKEGSGRRRHIFARDILAIVWRFLRDHEHHVAAAAGVAAFDVVTTVPSKTTDRDAERAILREMIGDHCNVTRDRYRRALRPTDAASGERAYEPERYAATMPLDGKSVLLIDDTWTTGASAQAAAHALRLAGASAVGVVVVGRHVNTGYSDHGARIEQLPRPFDFGRCAVE